jgi:outer membrane protein assembly factor BamB
MSANARFLGMLHNRRMRFALLLLLLPTFAAADNWPQWRGPTADGISKETGLPTTWSASENVRWKAPLRGLGTSTPVIWGDLIFLTAQIGDGPLAEGARDFDDAAEIRKFGKAGVVFFVQAFRKSDGSLAWEKSFDAGSHVPEVHIKHNLSSPSCVTDGKLVYAWFGTGLVVALTMDGKEAWRRNLAEENSPFDVRWGHGSSPMLYEDALMLLVDHPDDSYLLAVDKTTGKDVWRTDREAKRSYTTPFLVKTAAGDLLIVNTNHGLEAIDAKTGKQRWSVGEENRVPVPTPVHHDGTLYVNRGYNSSPFLAVRLDSGEPDVRWEVPTGAPYVSSLVYANGLLFMATERGIASAVDAETGKPVWKERLDGVFSASPIFAGGKIYFSAESGVTYVVDASREFNVVSKNDLGERTLASLAVSDGTVFVRTDEHLVAIGE